MGPVTREILNTLSAYGELICFERNAGFCRSLEMRGYLSEVKVGLVPWNFPPALVYVATQKEPTATA